jgi:plastocyanin
MLLKMLALSLLAPLVLLAACGDDDNATSTPKPAGTTAAASTTAKATGTAAATTAAAGTTAAGGSTQNVAITASEFAFDKTSLTAKAGDTLHVTLTNGDSAEHSFTVGDTDVTEAEGGATGTGDYKVKTGDTEFHCKYHPTTMKGTITVTS